MEQQRNKRTTGGGVEVSYEYPAAAPSESAHWLSLHHEPSDRLVHNLEQLKVLFRAAVAEGNDAKAGGNSSNGGGKVLAIWSCLLGYCELVSTHKQDDRRYNIYPIPYDALVRLVTDDFIPSLQALDITTTLTEQPSSSKHRYAARCVSNYIWSRVPTKSNVRDEKHANSLYVCVNGGRLDNRSLDCFGSALCTVIGLKCLGHKDSFLTLSEDHAYESHPINRGDGDGQTETPTTTTTTSHVMSSSIVHTDAKTTPKVATLATCEVAVPGNTNLAQSKRGREIENTFAEKKNSRITPQTSWLYMASSPVVCHTVPLVLAAAISNINCTIGDNSRDGGKRCKCSGQLFELKRELLWILYDMNCLQTFPYALMELGDCEENRTSSRGEKVAAITTADGSTFDAIMLESLYHDAISISRNLYNDRQVYPYCYPGHYHKDAGTSNGPEEEYRLVEALRLYSEAARVSSSYIHDSGDTIQLSRVIVKLAEYIVSEILSSSNGGGPRQWTYRDNAVAAATFVLAFFDYLLLWEERTGTRFLAIISSNHKHSIGKAFALFPNDVRCDAIAKMTCPPLKNGIKSQNKSPQPSEPITCSTGLRYYTRPVSQRLPGLLPALGKKKITIGDMELGIVVESSGGDGEGGGRSKRRRKAKLPG